jgi:hypothetical protein
MNSNDLLSIIAKLEMDLKEIDSARTQVSNTIKAYKDVSIKIDRYAKSLDKIPNDIATMIETVKSNQETLNSELNQDLKNKIEDIERQVLHLKSVTDSVSKSLAIQYNGVVADFKSSINAEIKSADESRQRLDAGISDFTKMSSKIEQNLIEHGDDVIQVLLTLQAQNDMLSENLAKNGKILFALQGVIIVLMLIVGFDLLAK